MIIRNGDSLLESIRNERKRHQDEDERKKGDSQSPLGVHVLPNILVCLVANLEVRHTQLADHLLDAAYL